MTLKERIKAECKKKGISVSKLEKDLGFANAYINQLNPETIQHSRLIKIRTHASIRKNIVFPAFLQKSCGQRVDRHKKSGPEPKPGA